MAISDAFLKGFTVTQEEEKKNLAQLNALINYRPNYGAGYAAAGGGGSAGGDPLARVNEASRRYEAEQDREEARQMGRRAEEREIERHGSQMLSERLMRTGEHLRQAAAAEDRAVQSAWELQTTPLQEALYREQEEVVRNRAAGRKIYDGYISGDASKVQEGLNERFGIGGYGAAATYGGAAKIDPETGEVERDKEGNIVYEEMKPGKAYRGMDLGMKVSTDDAGNMWIQYPTEDGEYTTPERLTPNTLENFMGITAAGVSQQYGAPAGPGAPAAGGQSYGQMSAKDRADFYVKSYKAGVEGFEARHQQGVDLCSQPDGTIDQACYKKVLKESAGVLGALGTGAERDEKTLEQGGGRRMDSPQVKIAQDAGVAAAEELIEGLDQLADNPELARQLYKTTEARLEKIYGSPALFALQDAILEKGQTWFTNVDHSMFSGGEKSKIPTLGGRGMKIEVMDYDPATNSWATGGGRYVMKPPEQPPPRFGTDIDETPPPKRPPQIEDTETGETRDATPSEIEGFLTQALEELGPRPGATAESQELLDAIAAMVEWLNTAGRQGDLPRRKRGAPAVPRDAIQQGIESMTMLNR